MKVCLLDRFFKNFKYDCELSIYWCTCIINMMRVSFSQGFLTIIESKLASIQIKYMIKFVSARVCVRILRFPPPIKLTAMIL